MSTETPLRRCSTEPITLAIEWFDFPVIFMLLLVITPINLLSISLLTFLYNAKSVNGDNSPLLIDFAYALNASQLILLYLISVNSSIVGALLPKKDRKNNNQEKAEIKVAIAYDGWKKEGQDRYSLHEKVAAAGFEKSKEFQEYREAVIAERFNLDEVEVRILNGDGGSWIKKVKDRDTIFQLDPFHKNKAVRELIHEKQAQKDILELLSKKDISGVFAYLETYSNSLSDDKDIEDVQALIRYYENNRNGLLPYQAQLKSLPAAPKGIEYLNLGTMENHIWSIIAKRMKHNHTSWSKACGNNLAKILAYKDLIVKYLAQYGSARRKDIQTLLLDKLPSVMEDKQKEDKIRNLLTSLRKQGIIRTDSGNQQKSSWILTDKIKQGK